MGWYKDINSILEQQPEAWLAYLYGQQLENLRTLRGRKPPYTGFVLQLFKFFYHIGTNIRSSNRGPKLKNIEHVIFAGTGNQLVTLEPTVAALRNRHRQVAVIVGKAQYDTKALKKGYRAVSFGLVDVYRALLLLVVRGPKLYRDLQKDNAVAAEWYFSTFCQAYIYLVYFWRILRDIRPDYVITANDHNVSNRSMMAVAHFLGIKTVYMQHASVSGLFPALRVDYAFLDGQSALDTYRLCEINQPQAGFKAPLPKIILSGQKKHIVRSEKTEDLPTGVAINTLDDCERVIDFICTLAEAGKKVCLRWHPSQSRADLGYLFRNLLGHPYVSFSDPRKESASEFLSKVAWVVAANTSIHLEAALAGASAIYYEFGQPELPDYYGYVKNGLAKPARSVNEVISILEECGVGRYSNIDAVRFYSATYMTDWDGKEAELVAECLCSHMVNIPDLARFHCLDPEMNVAPKVAGRIAGVF